ncbi:MAG TPA: hypothetical protein VMH27_02955 [Puia sp.]|nr:hypothetical protein [Puia sp.]
MKILSGILLTVLLPATSISAQVIIPKLDTTVKFGKTGYRVECKNKSYGDNQLEVRPVGFSNEARDVNFMMRGRVAKAEIDDLNGDGYPDLILYVYADSNAIFGTVFAFISKANKSIVGCTLPDPMMDGKVNEGYKGHDRFSVMEGYLLDKFPIYKPGDSKDNPSGGTRVILYQLVPDEGDRFKFQKVRNYDTH